MEQRSITQLLSSSHLTLIVWLTNSIVGIKAGVLNCSIVGPLWVFPVFFMDSIRGISIGESIVCKVNLEQSTRNSPECCKCHFQLGKFKQSPEEKQDELTLDFIQQTPISYVTDLVLVSVTQHKVGSFDVSVDILVFMNILQNIHLTQTPKHNQQHYIAINFMHCS